MEIRSLQAADVAAAFALATQVFVEHGTLHRALGADLETYRAYLRPEFQAMVDEGLSVCAVDPSGRMLGCMIVVDFHGPLRAAPGRHPVFAPVSALMSALGAAYARQYTIAPGEVILIDMGAVVTEATGAGVYRAMRAKVQRIAGTRGFRRVVGELSSAATQHVVLNRLGHKKIAEIAFAGFEHQGKRPFASITDPPGIILAEGDL